MVDESVSKTLTDSGFEIYGEQDGVIHLAERVRFHLMESGVSLITEGGLSIEVTIKASRSNFPHELDEGVVQRLRDRAADLIAAGWSVGEPGRVQVNDPQDPERVLDEWLTLKLTTAVETLDEALPLLRSALETQRELEPPPPTSA